MTLAILVERNRYAYRITLLDALQIQGIIPRSPSPPALDAVGEGTDVTNMSPEEMWKEILKLRVSLLPIFCE